MADAERRPDRAWAERFFLIYSVAWIAGCVLVVLSGQIYVWGDLGYLVFSLATGLPAVLGPLAFRQRPRLRPPAGPSASKRGYEYWLKFNVWVFVLAAFGTFFGTHYFFDLMGMTYAFPVQWTLQAEMVGHSSQRVPIFMYPLTHAYFITYHAVMLVLLRLVVGKLSLGRIGRGVAIALIAYAVAFAETFVMANEALSQYFEYASRTRMLWLGSVGYAAYYVVSLPMIARLDDVPEQWPLSRVVLDALGASMLVMILLELWGMAVGPL